MKSVQPQTYVKPEAAITVFELLMMSGVSLETCWAIKKHWNYKFYYTVASCSLFLYDFLLFSVNFALTIPKEGKCPDTRFWTRSISRNVCKHSCNLPSALCSVVWGPKTNTDAVQSGRCRYLYGCSQYELSSPLSTSVCHLMLSKSSNTAFQIFTFKFHSCIVHSDVIHSFISPTNAQLIGFKILKFTLKYTGWFKRMDSIS